VSRYIDDVFAAAMRATAARFEREINDALRRQRGRSARQPRADRGPYRTMAFVTKHRAIER